MKTISISPWLGFAATIITKTERGPISGGLFLSEGAGNSWQLTTALWNVPRRALWFGDGYDDPGIHSTCVDPRNSDQGVGVDLTTYNALRLEDPP